MRRSAEPRVRRIFVRTPRFTCAVDEALRVGNDGENDLDFVGTAATTVTIRWLFPVLIYAAMVIVPARVSAVEITGKIRSASGQTAVVAVDGDSVPSVGDKAEIFFKLPGVEEEISVATGKVAKVEGDAVHLKIENATGDIANGQLVRVKSDKPSALPPLPSPSPSPHALTERRPEEPTEVGQMASKTVTFEQFPIGPLRANVFAKEGLTLEAKKGRPEVFAAQPNMLLPSPCTKVMIVGGGPVTALAIDLDPPVKRFALYRVGTQNGASTPTWTMTAYDSNGKVLGSTGEEHGLPAEPRYFEIDADGITRIELTSDNRHGTGTWATWNALPVAGFGFDR